MRESYADLVRDDAVHRDAYVDPAVFAAEMAAIFGRAWVYVGHASEIPAAGDYKTAAIGLNPAIVVRQADGAVAVLLNRCAHRGLTVCRAGSGNAAFFRCAYHGWTYDTGGTLTGVPFPNGYDERFERGAFGLGRVPRVDAYRDFIFASLNPDAGDLRAWLAGAAAYLDAFTDSSPAGTLGANAGAHRVSYRGNWKLQLEGSVDGYHPYVLHKSFFDFQSSRAGARHDIYSRDTTTAHVAALGNGHMAVDSGKEFVRGNVFYDRTRMSPGGPELIAELEQQYGADETRRLLNVTGGEGFNIGIFPNLAIIQSQIRTITPVAVDRTNVELRPTTLGGVPAKINALRLRAHELFFGPAGFGSPDDLEAFTRSQAGLAASPMPWMDFSRGRSRERPDGARIAGEITDETHQRGMYRQWRTLMAAATPAFAAR